VIGTNGGGSAVDVAIRAMLKKHGLEEKRDYTMLEGPARHAGMLLEKKADLIPAVLPSRSIQAQRRRQSPVRAEGSTGHHPDDLLERRKGFIEKNRAAMVDFMEDMLVITAVQRPKNTRK